LDKSQPRLNVGRGSLGPNALLSGFGDEQWDLLKDAGEVQDKASPTYDRPIRRNGAQKTPLFFFQKVDNQKSKWIFSR